MHVKAMKVHIPLKENKKGIPCIAHLISSGFPERTFLPWVIPGCKEWKKGNIYPPSSISSKLVCNCGII